MLELPAVASMLCSLELGHESKGGRAIYRLERIAPMLAGATKLIQLELDMSLLRSPQAGLQLAAVLQACHNLEVLRLQGFNDQVTGLRGVLQAIVGIPGLRTLCCSGWCSLLSKDLVRTAPCLTQFVALEPMCVTSGADVRCLATLTQLTL